MLVRLLVLTAMFSACSDQGFNTVVDQQPLRDDTPDDKPVDNGTSPVADAGEDIEARPLLQVELDGSRSYDPAGKGVLIPTWSIVRAPDGSTTEIERADSMHPTFFADLAGDYTFLLHVTNGDGVRSHEGDEVVVHVRPRQNLFVQVSWNTDTDLDLHLFQSHQTMWDRDDCNWCNLNPDWGRLGVDGDDPSLDWDAIDGWGPETVTLMEPAEGEYQAQVDFYGQDGDAVCRWDCPETIATADIFVDGELVQTLSTKMTFAGEVWDIASIEWPSGNVVIHDRHSWTSIDDCL